MNHIPSAYESAFGKNVKKIDHWENNGWGIYLVDAARSVEFLVWTSPYIVRAGIEFTKNITTVQTLVAPIPMRTVGELRDNDFIYAGWDVQDHYEEKDLRIRENKNSVTWELGGRTYTFGNNRWKITGEHSGVNFDLVLDRFGSPIWYVGPPMDPLRSLEGWYWAFANLRGKISIKEKLHRVEGCAIHERHIMHGQRFNLAKETQGKGFTWFVGLGQDYRFLLSDFKGRGQEFSFQTSSSQSRATADEVTMEIQEEWTDPRSRFRVPCKWRLSVDSDSVQLDAEVRGYARAYYPWTFMKRSYSVLYFFLSSMKGYYVLKEGSPRKLEFGDKDRCYVHTNWSFHQRQ